MPQNPFVFVFGKRYAIPDYMQHAILDYVNKGHIPGDFLQAVICNDLREAVGRADENNIGQLPAYMNYFYNYAPYACWGSRENMEAWVESKKKEQEERNKTE